MVTSSIRSNGLQWIFATREMRMGALACHGATDVRVHTAPGPVLAGKDTPPWHDKRAGGDAGFLHAFMSGDAFDRKQDDCRKVVLASRAP
jgi:hypothetical protein